MVDVVMAFCAEDIIVAMIIILTLRMMVMMLLLLMMNVVVALDVRSLSCGSNSDIIDILL